MKTFSRLRISSNSEVSVSKKALLQATIPNGAFDSENINKPSLLPKPASTKSPEMRQDLRPCLGLLEARLSPPVPRDHEEQAFLSCYSSCLTSLLRSCHLSLAWVLNADLTHPWGPGSSIGALSTPGPPRHTVTALLRDQDKVLPHGICTGKFHHPLGSMMPPFGPREGFQLGACGLALLSLAVVPLANPVLPRPSRD